MKSNIVHVTLIFVLLVVFTTPATSQWAKTKWSASAGFLELYSKGNTVFTKSWDSLNGGQMFLTEDNGETWTKIASADNNVDILSVVLLNSGILAGTWNGFFKSPLGNVSWNATALTGIPGNSVIWSVTMTSKALFAGTKGSVYKSTDSGTTWTEIKSGLPANARIVTVTTDENSIFAGTDSSGVFKTTIQGTSWTAVNTGLADKHIKQLAVTGANLFAVTWKGISVSDNGGTSWKASAPSLKDVNCILTISNQIFVGTDTSGVYRSTDNGTTWTPFNEGIQITRVWSLVACGNNIFAGTGNGIYRVPSTTTQASKTDGKQPVYPKGLQFSRHVSELTVTFALSRPETITLEIYDFNGKRLQSLVQGNFDTGVQSVNFSTGTIARGSYVLRLSAGKTLYQRIISIQ